ncbi:MAG: ATP-binding protein [Campylobacterales bacterium]|nr:ATP-binding protein [Campylobacterales bacterium]
MKQIEIISGVNQAFLAASLTQDITSLASIFDLIDNSIDAAKEAMLKSGKLELDAYGMPKTYQYFSINIHIDKDSFVISDNCSGMKEDLLKNKVLVIGELSDHEYGLGRYGIGLKRALLKLGQDYIITTDNLSKKITFSFSHDNLLKTSKLLGSLDDSTNSSGTSISIRNLSPSFRAEIDLSLWINKLVDEICIRYGIFLQKGLKITLSVNGQRQEIHSKVPRIDTNCPKPQYIREQSKFHSVSVFIESGIHEEYQIGAAYGINNRLTDSFGWYVICNDRVIEFARRDGADFGWKSNWHSEYNGFIGFIRFHSKDVANLPWDTTKTSVVTDSILFLTYQERFTAIASGFRHEIKAARKIPSSPSKNSSARDKEKSKKDKADTKVKTNFSSVGLFKNLTSEKLVVNSFIQEFIFLYKEKRAIACYLTFRTIIESQLHIFLESRFNTFYTTNTLSRAGFKKLIEVIHSHERVLNLSNAVSASVKTIRNQDYTDMLNYVSHGNHVPKLEDVDNLVVNSQALIELIFSDTSRVE